MGFDFVTQVLWWDSQWQKDSARTQGKQGGNVRVVQHGRRGLFT